jgi:hypothetical protein
VQQQQSGGPGGASSSETRSPTDATDLPDGTICRDTFRPCGSTEGGTCSGIGCGATFCPGADGGTTICADTFCPQPACGAGGTTACCADTFCPQSRPFAVDVSEGACTLQSSGDAPSGEQHPDVKREEPGAFLRKFVGICGAPQQHERMVRPALAAGGSSTWGSTVGSGVFMPATLQWRGSVDDSDLLLLRRAETAATLGDETGIEDASDRQSDRQSDGQSDRQNDGLLDLESTQAIPSRPVRAVVARPIHARTIRRSQSDDALYEKTPLASIFDPRGLGFGLQRKQHQPRVRVQCETQGPVVQKLRSAQSAPLW